MLISEARIKKRNPAYTFIEFNRSGFTRRAFESLRVDSFGNVALDDIHHCRWRVQCIVPGCGEYFIAGREHSAYAGKAPRHRHLFLDHKLVGNYGVKGY